MQEKIYKQDETHEVIIGKKIFMVSSFVDSNSSNTAEDLLIRLLKTKVAEELKEESA